MPAFFKRAEQNISEELVEFSNYGPFGGVQSEVPLDLVEQMGQTDILNMVLRKSNATIRPGYTTLAPFPAPADEPIVGIADFFDLDGVRIQVVMTTTRLLKWEPATQDWTVITGALTGGATNLFTWSVVNQQLLFCQGVDDVQLWDGVTAGFAPASADAVPAKFLFELSTHLIAAYTIEGGQDFTQRVRWTAAGDPTDWVGFSAGVNDILGDLGPITGGIKIYQTGYIFHQWGITQMIPTGIAANPFQFVPLTTRARGNTIPYSLAPSGEEFGCYAGKDNIYVFNGTNSVPMAAMPAEGRRLSGARSRIFGDLGTINQQRVTAYVSDNVNGQCYPAYWLVIPTVDVWLYNFDEQNWTRFEYGDSDITMIGRFFRQEIIRIIDLVGTIADQNWTFDTLAGENPADAVLLGTVDGHANLVDFTNTSERPWLFGGQFVFGDPRHSKTVKKFRVTIADNGPVTFTVTLRNQYGTVVSQTVTMGSNTGLDVSQTFSLAIPGMRIGWEISGEEEEPFTLVEFCPIYSIGGEQRGGQVDL